MTQIASSIIGVADVGVKLSTALYTFATSVASADKSIIDIASDVALTSNVLTNVGNFLSDKHGIRVASASAVQDANSILKRCQEAFDEIQDITEKYFKAHNHSLKSLGNLAKIAWPTKVTRLELLKKRLESLKSSLMLLLSVLKFRKDQENGSFDQQQIQQQSQSIHNLYHRHRAALADVRQLERRLELTKLDDNLKEPWTKRSKTTASVESSSTLISDSNRNIQSPFITARNVDLETGVSNSNTGHEDYSEFDTLIKRAQQFLIQVEKTASLLSSHSFTTDHAQKVVNKESHLLFNYLSQYLEIDVSPQLQQSSTILKTNLPCSRCTSENLFCDQDSKGCSNCRGTSELCEYIASVPGGRISRPATCLRCRARRSYCNKALPMCSGCRASGSDCSYPTARKTIAPASHVSEMEIQLKSYRNQLEILPQQNKKAQVVRIGRDKMADAHNSAVVVSEIAHISKDELDIRTLEYFHIEYEDDPNDPDKIRICQSLTTTERQILLDHTRRVRIEDANSLIARGIATSKQDVQYAFVRRRRPLKTERRSAPRDKYSPFLERDTVSFRSDEDSDDSIRQEARSKLYSMTDRDISRSASLAARSVADYKRVAVFASIPSNTAASTNFDRDRSEHRRHRRSFVRPLSRSQSLESSIDRDGRRGRRSQSYSISPHHSSRKKEWQRSPVVVHGPMTACEKQSDLESPWRGQRVGYGALVRVGSLGSAKPKRHIIEPVVGGLAASRLANGASASRARSESRSISRGRSRSRSISRGRSKSRSTYRYQRAHRGLWASSQAGPQSYSQSMPQMPISRLRDWNANRDSRSRSFSPIPINRRSKSAPVPKYRGIERGVNMLSSRDHEFTHRLRFGYAKQASMTDGFMSLRPGRLRSRSRSPLTIKVRGRRGGIDEEHVCFSMAIDLDGDLSQAGDISPIVKGTLRKPVLPFPDEPAMVREGVAPIKEGVRNYRELSEESTVGGDWDGQTTGIDDDWLFRDIDIEGEDGLVDTLLARWTMDHEPARWAANDEFARWTADQELTRWTTDHELSRTTADDEPEYLSRWAGLF